MILNAPVFIESLQILGRADNRVHKGRAHGRLANLFKRHAIAGGIQFLKVVNNLRPACEFTIVAGAKTQYVFRRGNGFVFGKRDVGAKDRVGLNRERDEQQKSER